MTTTREHDRPGSASLAVSTVIFALRSDEGIAAENDEPTIWLPLVRRIRDPYDGRWALPGGPLGHEEGLADAAARSLSETTGLTSRYLEQLYAFGDVDRSPGERVVSIVYWALVDGEEARRAQIGQNVRWFPADRLPRLAFDHNTIVDYALWRLRTKMEYSDIARSLLGETFTLSELRAVHEAVLRRRLDPANFRRQIDAQGRIEATGESRRSGAHRPARLYRYAADDATGPPSPYAITPDSINPDSINPDSIAPDSITSDSITSDTINPDSAPALPTPLTTNGDPS
ncbi:NUDIX hydrolase [Labedella endophytica]|uniref:NUDIX domain-containing protein n=1 Tax=Labedella endophytica TaxID=1523160 RepID=A0A3S0VSD5_9MICO|nr:NUDIX domain-containing protein [Labedella endophytica]RUQ99225.1 NUDIX domain-containing protein [Labedella endophytica]